ncbi:universal stress protein [Candidatus Nitronereus thalassa]|uniref:Universal stress protein n=1 Tax=Candidatus Nitronereus thalassa TaxID=3020898 RepID=A0ABU3K305_9BACT|nr:universal stress protein [Candidatus Nitronereus thalassa]MDT7040772.1 universal stress protein [Candidatus Nitronereus thalassa]
MKNIFHPSDFTEESEVAFAHALKIALPAKANLSMFHVHEKRDDEEWTEFPGVRNLLVRWKLIPEGSSRDEVRKLGLGIQKIQGMREDPVASILGYLESTPNDLIVLTTHQQKGIDRLLHKAIAEPVARESKQLTLFIPQEQKGFVSLKDGKVSLQRILIPVDQNPLPQAAIDAASGLVHLLNGNRTEFTIVHVGSHKTLPPFHLSNGHDSKWKTIVSTGNVVEQILKIAEDRAPDLIVMATQGHQGFLDALRGSTTERVLRAASCPILAVPVE